MMQIFVDKSMDKLDYITDLTKSIYIPYLNLAMDYHSIKFNQRTMISIHDFNINGKYLTDDDGNRYPNYLDDEKDKDYEFLINLRSNIFKLINNIDSIEPFAFGQFNSKSNTLMTMGFFTSTLRSYQLDTVVMIDHMGEPIPTQEFILYQNKDLEKVEKFMQSIKYNNMIDLSEIRSYCMDNQSNKTIDNINLEG